jgi:hypothetical protein
MKYILLVFLHLLIIRVDAQKMNIKGYYLELIYNNPKTGKTSHAEFLFDIVDDLKKLLLNPLNYNDFDSFRILNYTSYYLDLIEDSMMQEVKIKQSVNWNLKVSLYRGNDNYPNYLLRLNDSNFAFYIKKVDVNVKKIIIPRISLNYSDTDLLPTFANQLYLLQQINNQSFIKEINFKNDKEYELIRIPIEEAISKFHPASNNRSSLNLYEYIFPNYY